MKKYILILLSIFTLLAWFLPAKVSANTQPAPLAKPVLLAQGTGLGQGQVASDGAWLTDPDVTFAGKTASRSASLFNWVLVNYKWSYGDNTLVLFWAKIRNIVYAFLVLLVIITAFTMIITGGQSITAIQFLRKFLVVLFLITLSFALIRFFYQIVDIITGFFIRNPDGDIISSKDLFNMSFGYEDFIGWRRYGPSFDESAFVSLLLVKITAVTYYVMAGILIVRKVILWFFITVSPIYPILLLYFPVRNTAKIWLGEFFRWLLYAPLFTIFLSGLVYLYRDDINVMNFNFTGAGTKIVYPTAINILLGGPGQRLDITNSVNYNDTFAEYIIALIMVWVVIFLPFLLLRIFLDYLSNITINKDMAMNYLNNAMGYIVNKDRLFINRPQSPISPKTPPSLQPTGSARQIPFSSGSAKEITYGGAAAATANNYTQINTHTTTNANRGNVTTYNQVTNRTTNVANLKRANVNSEALHLVNFPIPTMRDVARFETSRLTNQSTTKQEMSKVRSTLEKIANPYAIQSSVEREHFSSIREKLFQAKLKGDQVATSILNAANNETTSNQRNTTNTTNITNISNAQKNLHETIQKLANPGKIESVKEREQFTSIKERLTQEAHQGNPLATTILNSAQHISSVANISSEKSMHETLQKIAHPEAIQNANEKQKFTEIKNKLVEDSKNGNPVAKSVLNSVSALQQTEKVEEKHAAPAVSLPSVNQVQSVNLDDYENVKKMWLENYRKISVPKTIDKPNRTRQEWIKEDMNKIDQAISLLISGDQQKVSQGMSLVSNILPFLLIGGFSQSEVLAYLKAKEVAGAAILKELEATATTETENESFVSARKGHRHAAMHNQMAESLNDIDTSSLSGSDEYEEEENPLTASINRIKQQNEQITQILNMISLHIPSIRDVARAESAPLRADTTRQDEVKSMQTTLQNIANPESLPSVEEREHFTRIKEQLLQEKEKGDTVATSILNAANNLSTANYQITITNKLTTIAQSLAQPETLTNEHEKEQYSIAKETLIKESKEGNIIAQAVLQAVTDVTNNNPISNTVYETLNKIANSETVSDPAEKEKLSKDKQEVESDSKSGNPAAISILQVFDAMTGIQKPAVTSTLPTENQVQTVNLDDYENVKKLWIENYQKADVPKSLDKPHRTREEWITQDLSKITKTISLLTSGQDQKVKEGMGNVSNILPFLLIGGFSQSEIIAYLKAKEVAGQEVLRRLKDIQQHQTDAEETELEVGNKKKDEEEKAMEAAQEEATPTAEKEIMVPVETSPISKQEQKQEDDSSLVDASLSNNQEIQEGQSTMAIRDETPEVKLGDLTPDAVDVLTRGESDQSFDNNPGEENTESAQMQPTEGSQEELPSKEGSEQVSPDASIPAKPEVKNDGQVN